MENKKIAEELMTLLTYQMGSLELLFKRVCELERSVEHLKENVVSLTTQVMNCQLKTKDSDEETSAEQLERAYYNCR